MLKKAMYAALLVGATFGSCFTSCCDLKLPDIPNLGGCFSAKPCELLILLLGGIA